MKNKEYPEHEKMKAVQDDSQKIGTFLDWLSCNNMVICNVTDSDEYPFSPINESIEQLLSRYYNIDLQKIENEKLAMLEEIRSAQRG